jgi:hypothetical protein
LGAPRPKGPRSPPRFALAQSLSIVARASSLHPHRHTPATEAARLGHPEVLACGAHGAHVMHARARAAHVIVGSALSRANISSMAASASSIVRVSVSSRSFRGLELRGLRLSRCLT